MTHQIHPTIPYVELVQKYKWEDDNIGQLYRRYGSKSIKWSDASSKTLELELKTGILRASAISAINENRDPDKNLVYWTPNMLELIHHDKYQELIQEICGRIGDNRETLEKYQNIRFDAAKNAVEVLIKKLKIR